MSNRAEQVQQIVGVSAVAIGAGNVLAPRAAGRFWDVPDAAPIIPHLGRIYGIAMAALGAQLLMAGEQERRGNLRLAAVVGAGTAAADVLSWARGRLGARGAITGVLAAGGLGALAWVGAQE